MPKAESVDTFTIHVSSVPPTHLGDTMALLAKAGLTDVRVELVTSIPTFRHRATHDVDAAEFLKLWIVDHPTFKAKEVVVHFDLHGRTAGAAYSALRELSDDGTLKKLGGGNYARKDVKQLAGPGKKAKPVKPHDISHPDFILKKIRHRAGFTRDEVKALLKGDKRQPSSVGPTLSTLLKRGDIKRVSEGKYAPVVKGNGSAQVAEAAHG